MSPLEAEVSRLFERLDARDLDAFLDAFVPGAVIVHDDGRAGTPLELTKELGRPPERRALSAFRSGGGGRLAWIGYENEVVFGGRTLRFTETAVLLKSEGRWKFARIRYFRRRDP